MSDSDNAKLFKVGIFSDKFFHGVRHFRQLPQKGDYIDLCGQKLLGYIVTRVVFLDWNPDHWDIALVIGNGSGEPSKEIFYAAGWKIVDERMKANQGIQRDKTLFEKPNEAWQRRRDIYERHKIGETLETIAEDLNLTVKRTKALEGEWRRLRQRYLWRKESELEAATEPVADAA